MARLTVYLLEDKGPGHIGRLADDLRVHEVAQADAAGGEGGGNSDIVEHCPEAQLGLAAIEPQGNHQAQRTTVGGQSGIPRELPTAVGHLVYGQEHLHEMGA